jgi:hypothetical protein
MPAQPERSGLLRRYRDSGQLTEFEEARQCRRLSLAGLLLRAGDDLETLSVHHRHSPDRQLHPVIEVLEVLRRLDRHLVLSPGLPGEAGEAVSRQRGKSRLRAGSSASREQTTKFVRCKSTPMYLTASLLLLLKGGRTSGGLTTREMARVVRNNLLSQALLILY